MASIISSKISYSDTFVSTLPSRTESFEESYKSLEQSSKGIEEIVESAVSTSRQSENSDNSLSDSDVYSYSSSHSTSRLSSHSSSRVHSHSSSRVRSRSDTDDQITLMSTSHTEWKPDIDTLNSSESFTLVDKTEEASFSDTQSYRSELSFVDDSQDTTSGQYSYSETFEPSVLDTQTTYSATTCSVPARTLEPLKEESDFEESQTERKDTTSTFERSPETKTSYEDTFELADSYSFRLRSENIHQISEEDITEAETVEAREDFIKKTCQRIKQWKSHPRIHQKKVIHEDPVIKSYCRQKIKQLNRATVKKKDILTEVAQDTMEKKPARRIPLETYGLNPAILERIKLTNLIERMKRMSHMEIHEVSKCRKCRKQRQLVEESALQRQFLQHHTHKLLSRNMDEKVMQHLIKMNSVNLIGEMLSHHPSAKLDSSDLLYEYQRQISLRKERNQ